ncbi:MAG: hypothetical protein CVU38_16555 [Chloroflexi bacterium HGW-Chloroflexi-1]|nr:MAG: hypothetical protein CVU38_16555 [Chloroflexi bacterium HGW-Chloroflexi-1]
MIAISPNQRFRLADGGEISMRVVDLIAPIGKGPRGLIVSLPKAGKTTLLARIARSVCASDPDTRIIIQTS